MFVFESTWTISMAEYVQPPPNYEEGDDWEIYSERIEQYC